MDRTPAPQRTRVRARTFAAILVIALSALAQPTAATAKRLVTPKAHGYVVNGVPTGGPIAWQVALVRVTNGGVAVPYDVFCGGTLRDSTHVITAAHCVPEMNAGSLAVVWNLNRRSDGPSAGAELRGVAAITSHPEYNNGTLANDLALLTLSSPMPVPDTYAMPITPSLADWEAAAASVTGWGLFFTGGPQPDDLQYADVTVLNDSACSAYGATYKPEQLLCARGANPSGIVDICEGDSGGPLVSAGQLIGVVSFASSLGCADPDGPGAYVELSNADFNARATDPNPPPRPEPISAASVQGTPVAGQTLTCDTGQWTQPATFTFRWLSGVLDAAGKATDVRSEGTAQTLPLTAAHAGRVVGCQAKAIGLGGTRQGNAKLVAVSAAPQAPSAPPAAAAPQGAAAPQDSATPQGAAAPPPVAIPGDLIAPTSRFTRRSCRKRRCTLTITASDSGGPAEQVRLTFQRISGCKKGRRGRTCRKTRTLNASSRSMGVFTATTPQLTPAKYRFTVYATDASGNRGKKVSVALRVKRR